LSDLFIQKSEEVRGRVSRMIPKKLIHPLKLKLFPFGILRLNNSVGV
jgi:hypothetical protein